MIPNVKTGWFPCHPRPWLSAGIPKLGLAISILALCSCTRLSTSPHPVLPTTEISSPASHSPLALFRKFISPIDGDRCPMYPSCSTYSGEAFHKHGPILGWIMTCDRLMRCGRDELDRSARIEKGGKSYCYDPVDGNDFWW
jgi:putative component of membrane protein insertase Oxa1/YidC/SpoIIIJ protein YidD